MENEEATTTVEGVAEGGASDGGAALQNEMIGDFFHDEGIGAVVDAMGNEQLNEKNEPIRTMEEFNAYRAKKSGQPQQNTTQKAKPAQPAAQNTPKNFDSMFVKNGQPDFQKFSNQSEVFSKIKYSAMPAPKADPNQQATAPVDAGAQIKAEVEKYGKEIAQTHLAPIEKAWEKLAARFGGTANIPQDVAEAIREQYAEQQEQVRALTDAKKDELRDKHFNDQLAQKDFDTLRVKSDTNFGEVARRLFPNTTPDKQGAILSELLFGYAIKDANGNTSHLPGYGTDYLNHQFDMANSGKTFKTTQEWQEAYRKFWVNYANNPNNIELLAKIAYNEFLAAQEPKRRDAYRSQWEKEQAEKMKFNANQQPSAARGGNAGAPDEVQQQFDAFMRPPPRNQ